MNSHQKLAEILVASWRLASDDKKIPTSHGLLDRALKHAKEMQAFPDWVWDDLHFVDSRIGLECSELASVLHWAQRAALTAVPNPSYQTTEIKISQNASRRLLRDLGVEEDSARDWGNTLRQAVERAREDMEKFEQQRASACAP